MPANGLPSVTRRNRDSSVLLYEVEADTNEKTKGKAMTTRANYKMQSPELVKEGPIEEKVRALVAIRASQLNGCAFCLNTFCLRNTSALLPDRFLCKQPDDLYERGLSEFKQ